MSAWTLAAIALLANPPATHAAGAVKVWDASRPTRFAGHLPVRVQSLADGGVRIFSRGGSQVQDGSLCGSPRWPGPLQPWTEIDITKSVRGHCGEARFSRDGSIAILQDAQVRCGPGPYLRTFDVEERRFGAGEYRPDAAFCHLAIGRGAVACFVEVGKEHFRAGARFLRLEVLRAVRGRIEVAERWRDSTYVHLESAAMNDAGDIVALVATVGFRAIVPQPATWALLIAPAEGVPSLRPIARFDRGSKVAISDNGAWIAATRGGMESTRVDILSAGTLEQVGGSLLIADFIEERAAVVELAVSNRRAVAASVHVVHAPGSTETRVLLVRAPGDGETLQAIGSGYLETVLHFTAGRYLFVGSPGLPARTMKGIDGGPDEYLPPVEATACVYRD